MEVGELLGCSERQFRRSALRRGWACRTNRSAARQGIGASGAGGQAGVDAG
jgi:hypothetical protein